MRGEGDRKERGGLEVERRRRRRKFREVRKCGRKRRRRKIYME